MIDLNQEDNGDKFSMYETGFDEIGVRLISVGDDGEITINMHFDDSVVALLTLVENSLDY